MVPQARQGVWTLESANRSATATDGALRELREGTYTFTALSFSAFLSSAVGFTSYLQQANTQQAYKAVVEVEVGRGLRLLCPAVPKLGRVASSTVCGGHTKDGGARTPNQPYQKDQPVSST